MTKKLFTLLLAVAASVGTMFAENVKIGNLYYNLDAATQTAEVAINSSASGEIVIPSSVTYNSVSYSVTSIGDGAFSGCRGLTSLTIPNSVTSIGNYAFDVCTSLTSVTIGNSVTSIGDGAFSQCRSLTSVTIGNSVTGIGDQAFEGCSSLTSINVASDNSNYCSVDGVLFNKDKTTLIQYPGGKQGTYTIPNSVTSIGNDAFHGCSRLTSIDIPNNVTSIGNDAFHGCSRLTSIEIPNSVTSIGGSAFENCTGLTSVTIPNSVTSIGNSAFENCTGLTSVTIPNRVTSIGVLAFRNCTDLTSVMIGNSVTSIGDYAFAFCDSLTSVTIPNSVTSIGNEAFAYSGLTSINVASDNPNYCSVNGVLFNKNRTTLISYPGGKQGAYSIPNSVTSIGWGTFSGCSGLTSVTIPNTVTSIGERAFVECTGLTSVTIPNSVTSIGNEAFAYSGLTSVTIGNSVTSIGDWAFAQCSGLTSVTIPNSVTSIGDYAFYGCSSLTSVTIPNSVTSIGDYAFYGCSSLTSVTCFATTPPQLYSFVFDEVDKSIPLYVPAGSVSAYQSADQWKDFTNILPIEETPGTCITASGTCGAQGDNLTWELSCDSILTISGTGEMANYSNVSSVPWYSYNSSIQYVVIGNNVTSIGNYAIFGCSGLTSVTIPNSVTSIGEYAFALCTSLTSLTIPNSVTSIGNYAFQGCSSLTSLTIPNSVTSIGDQAFEGCSSLTSVTIPNSVTTIGSSAFYGCSGLTSVIWNAKNCADFATNNTPFYANYYDEERYQYIRFNLGPQITSFTFGNEVEHIPAYLCNGMSNLTSVTIPNSVTSIGYAAFSGCSGLTSITIPNNVTSIGNYAFRDCTGLASIVWNAKNYADFFVSNNTPFYYLRSLITSFTFGNEVEHIPAYLCIGMSNLTSIEIPNSVTSIGNWAFGYCTGLTSVTIPNSVTTIGWYAFYGCENLTSIEIPNSVTSIEEYAFSDCSGLTSLTCEAVTPPTLGSNVFLSVNTSIPLYVPAGSVSAYQSADQWKDFTNILPIGGYPSISLPIYIELKDNYGWWLSEGAIRNDYDTAFFYSSSFDYSEYVVHAHKTEDNLWRLIGHTTPEYRFIGWKDKNGKVLNQDTLCLYSSDTVTAVVSKQEYHVQVVPDNYMHGYTKAEYGYAGDTTISYGESINVTAIPREGFQFSRWSDGNTDNPREINILGDLYMTAFFDCKSFGGGYPSNIIDTIRIIAGDSVIISQGFPWQRIVFPVETGIYNDTLRTMYGCDSIVSHYVIVCSTQYTVSVDVNNSKYGSVEGAGTYKRDTTIFITAIPNKGYQFNEWSDGCTDNPRQVNVTQDSTFTAIFGSKMCSWIVESNDLEMGTIVTSFNNEYYQYGTQITVEASPNSGYKFVKWNDGKKFNPYKFSLLDDKYLLAIFMEEAEEQDTTTVQPSTTSATFTWPFIIGGFSYSLTIYLDVACTIPFCTITFNQYGQLIGISFDNRAPRRSMEQEDGFTYTVSGLDANTEYYFKMETMDEDNKLINTDEGAFRTTNNATGIENQYNTVIEHRKVMINGQILILRGDKTYTIQGQEVK